MRFVVVTGMSGAGKLTAQKMLEDMGYYCVDNLPVQLIVKFAELLYDSERDKVVLGIDVRADQSFDEIMQALEEMKEKGYAYEMLFLDASDKTLLKRYKESRRNHPLAMNGRVQEGIDEVVQLGVPAGGRHRVGVVDGLAGGLRSRAFPAAAVLRLGDRCRLRFLVLPEPLRHVRDQDDQDQNPRDQRKRVFLQELYNKIFVDSEDLSVFFVFHV